jgi:hypothetical protein
MHFPSRRLVGAILILGPALAAISTLTAAGPAAEITTTPPVAPVSSAHELFITNVGVVDDVRAQAGGPWHFGTMMRNLAGDVTPELFVDRWLLTMISAPPSAPVINGETVYDAGKAAAVAEFRNRWPKLASGALDLDQSPFRLLAIVNRPDLVKTDEFGPTAFGEARFIYGAYDPIGLTPQRFFVIFEFGVPADSCSKILEWANRWHGLGAFTLGSSAYNAALQAITDSIVLRDPNSSAPNQSHLLQFRSNEIELLDTVGDLVWNLREWNLIAAGSNPNQALLKPVTTKQTPHFSYVTTPAGRQVLQEYLDQNQAAILAGTHTVPDVFASPSAGNVGFETGNAINTCSHQTPSATCGISNQQCASSGTKWWAPGYVPQCNGTPAEGQIRHLFALQTCSGCHSRETGVQFTQVSNRTFGQEAVLDRFLTGNGYPINDTFFGAALPHTFGELAHRTYVLTRMLGLNCNENPLDELQSIQAEMGSRVH